MDTLSCPKPWFNIIALFKIVRLQRDLLMVTRIKLVLRVHLRPVTLCLEKVIISQNEEKSFNFKPKVHQIHQL